MRALHPGTEFIDFGLAPGAAGGDARIAWSLEFGFALPPSVLSDENRCSRASNGSDTCKFKRW